MTACLLGSTSTAAEGPRGGLSAVHASAPPAACRLTLAPRVPLGTQGSQTLCAPLPPAPFPGTRRSKCRSACPCAALSSGSGGSEGCTLGLQIMLKLHFEIL